MTTEPGRAQRVLGLAETAPSKDCIEAVEYLRQEVMAGRVIGLAWGALKPGYQYEVDAAGEAKKSPEFTQGVMLKLIRELGKLS